MLCRITLYGILLYRITLYRTTVLCGIVPGSSCSSQQCHLLSYVFITQCSVNKYVLVNNKISFNLYHWPSSNTSSSFYSLCVHLFVWAITFECLDIRYSGRFYQCLDQIFSISVIGSLWLK